MQRKKNDGAGNILLSLRASLVDRHDNKRALYSFVFCYFQCYLCCLSSYHITGETTHLLSSWLCLMCCGFHYNCHVSQEQEMDLKFGILQQNQWYLFPCGIIIGNECKSTWNNTIGYICVTSDNPVELLKQNVFLVTKLVALTAFHLQALDTFNTAIVSLLYYVMLTSLTILASVIMFKDWDWQNGTQIVTGTCGSPVILPLRRSKHTDKDGFESEDIPLRRQESLGSP
ncbi:hypothetical protein Bca52824_083217 [Brassica carinata]|uniref:Magnesium transporter n=1 Tax=Brassica carinata TaxID=52824 RepID=A0A8X7TTM3_BRACI|nr:hypothetical protein Bca52824_083217 [Brassica carinata]